MAGMATMGATPPAVPAGGKGKAPPAKGKKGVNPFAKKGAAPVAKGAPGKKAPIDPKTLASMKGSLNFK